MKVKEINMNFSSDIELGEVIGIFAGDGHLCFDKKRYHYIVQISSSLRNYDYICYVKLLFEKCFNTKFYWHKNGDRRNIIKISKIIFKFFENEYLKFNRHKKSKTVSIKEIPSNDFKIGFLRGFLDTDGTVCETKYGTRVAFYTSSPKLAGQIKELIKEFGFSCGLTISKRDGNIGIYLSRKQIEDFIRFLSSYKCRKWACRSTR